MAIIDKTKDFGSFFDSDSILNVPSFKNILARRRWFSLVNRNKEYKVIMDNVSKVMNGEIFSQFGNEDKGMECFFGKETNFLLLNKKFKNAYVIEKPVDQIEEFAKFAGATKEKVEEILSDTRKHYSRFFIWKDEAHTKKRWIEAPDDELKNIQNKILHFILYRSAPTKFAHGFCHGKSIVSCAKEHTGKKFVLKLDLKNFFPSIKRDMVYGAMLGELKPETVRIIIPAIEMCLMDGRLPQGAPTSPAISNIVCKPLDLIFSGISERYNMKYSRYADDLIFSSDSDMIYKVIPIIKSIITKFGLVVNEKKVKVLKKHQRQTVTGLVVNAEGKTSVRRRNRMNLRAYIHQILTGKKPIDRVNINRLRGNVNLINMANPEQGKWFVEKFNEILAMIK